MTRPVDEAVPFSRYVLAKKQVILSSGNLSLKQEWGTSLPSRAALTA